MPKLYDRLVSQLEAQGVKNPHAVATARLKKSGLLKPGTRKLTEKGKKRQAMGAAGRAKDRAAKASQTGKKPSQFKYSKKTNRATLKKK